MPRRKAFFYFETNQKRSEKMQVVAQIVRVNDDHVSARKVHFTTKPTFSQIRPDTRSPVADGWAGAEMRVFALSNSIITDGRTDGRTKPLIELRVRN